MGSCHIMDSIPSWGFTIIRLGLFWNRGIVRIFLSLFFGFCHFYPNMIMFLSNSQIKIIAGEKHTNSSSCLVLPSTNQVINMLTKIFVPASITTTKMAKQWPTPMGAWKRKWDLTTSGIGLAWAILITLADDGVRFTQSQGTTCQS